MDSKPPQPKPLRRKVHVVYYLSRGGQMDHPHLLEGYLSAAQDGLRLRDFKRWLAVLRGKSMPSTFAWSYKRSYKNGFIWHDLGDNDLIQPLCKNEYVLMGSEIKELAATGKCKCGGVPQTETKIVTEVGDVQQDSLSKSVLRSPKLVTKGSAINTDDQKSEGLMQIQDNSGRLVTSENNHYDNNKIINRGGVHRGGGSSRSFNELSAQKLLEEVKKPNSDTKYLVNQNYSLSRGSGNATSRALIFRDCEIVSEDQEEIVEANDIDEAEGDLREARRETGKGNNNYAYIKQATSTSKSRRDYRDGIMEDMMSDSHDNEDELNGTYIMDAATQTGDSTRCSTDHPEAGSRSAFCNNMLELAVSPGGSAKFSGSRVYATENSPGAIRRVSSARFHSNHAGSGVVIRGNLSKELLSKEFSNFPDVEKAIMINQASELAENDPQANVSSSNNNHIGSPTLSSCSGMSARSTRFAREDSNRSLPTSSSAANNITMKYMKPDHQHHHSTHHKGSSHGGGSSATGSSAPHTLLKQLLTCGNADVVTESKPTDHVIMSSNALSTGIQTPSRMISTGTYQGGHISSDKKGSNGNMWACKPGLMRRISTASSDNRSVVSATVSDQASISRDTLDCIISSPESAYYSSRHMKSIMRAHSLSSSVNFSGPQLQSAAAAGSTSPGMLSVGSSTSRRSSIRESDLNIASGGDVEEGFREALRSHHVGVKDSPKTRPNKGNKNTVLVHHILENGGAHDCRKVALETNNTTTRGSKTNSATVSELHKLICNPSGTPTCSHNHDKVISTNFATLPLEQAPNHHHHHHHIHSNTRGSSTPQHHQSKHILTPTHGPSRTPTRSKNSNSQNLAILSKSLNSPSPSMFLKDVSHPQPSSSSYISSWKDLLWSPRYNSSHKDKEKRHMKP
eukprot:c19258_g1_i1 orf=792-3515(+)